MHPINQYSRAWFETFLHTIEPAQTLREVDFIVSKLPLDSHPRILDVCCGSGRHAIELARRGYRVLGVDTDERVLHAARRAAPGSATFSRCDMRELAALDGMFDGVICLWQSFGNFDEASNTGVLQAIRERLRDGGRLILDIYNRDFHEARLGQRVLVRGDRQVVEHKSMRGSRLRVTLDYGDTTDVFEWQLYRTESMMELLRSQRLRAVATCTNFDSKCPLSPDNPRMQLVAEKVEKETS